MAVIFRNFFTIRPVWIMLFKGKMKLVNAMCLWLFLLSAATLQAQEFPLHYFDHRTLTDIQGQVLSMEFAAVYGKKSEFLMLSIQSDDQRFFRVEVCPQWFFAADIAVGMKIRIRGSLLQPSAGAFYLIAQEISLQGERITLRDNKGFPLWSRGGGSGRNDRRGPGGRGKK